MDVLHFMDTDLYPSSYFLCNDNMSAIQVHLLFVFSQVKQAVSKKVE